MTAGRLHLKLPATSANLGPGFDAVGLAMELFLEVEAKFSDRMEIVASGRDVEKVGALEGNTMLETYRELAPAGPNLKLVVKNGIPLGMGCGSSAAALVAGVELANHFGGLGMTRDEVLAEACRREGHPDNVAACLLGGFTVSAMVDGAVQTATFVGGEDWRLILVMPKSSLATTEARALLPESYPRADVVANLQATACWWRRLRRTGQSCWRRRRGTGCTSRTGWRPVDCCRGCCRWWDATECTR